MSAESKTDWRDLRPHPAAEVLPMMTPIEREKLKERLEAGYDPNQPIIVHEGQIVDGRNRHSVCLEGEIEPTVVEYAGDPANIGQFVLDRNVTVWRALNTHQQVLAYLLMAPYLKQELSGEARAKSLENLIPGAIHRVSHGVTLDGEDQKTEGEGNQSDSKRQRWTRSLEERFQTSHNTVYRCATVWEGSPLLARQVIQGEISMTNALKQLGYDRIGRPIGQQKAKSQTRKPKRPKELSLEGWETFIEGKLEAFMDVAEALLTIREQRLYTEHHGQFNHYLKERWGSPFQKGRAVTCGLDALLMARDEGEDR